jgi:tRNA A-37 threonylcarbamoyl transferase component Bud32
MAEVPQKSLERYDVLDRIAVGGMAEVFLAKAYGAHGFEKTLAIKRILPELARDPEFEERFIAEAKVAVRLSHTNVVQVFDFGRFAGSLFIAMEYVDGLDLAALLRRFKERHERVPLPAAFQIAIELTRGLDFAHTHGVVHRDVSPSNILLSKAGEVKIADFGIAVAAQPGRATTGGRRKVMGKWRYMSPEQARGEPLDTRSDMFSAASVMYELFTGDKLFPGDEAEDIIRNIHDMPLPKLSEVRRGLPPRLDQLLHHALARHPADRPTRPAVMLRALTELTYESSIVTTALDVAEAVGYVVDLSTPTGKRLDDIIRAQLANVAESSVARQTALGERKTAADRTGQAGGAAADGADGAERKTAEGSDAEDAERLTAVTIMRRKRRTGTEEAIRDDGGGRGGAGNDGGKGAAAAADDDDDDDDDENESAGAPPIEGIPVLIPKVDSDGLSRLELDETTVSVAPWVLGGSEPPAMPGGRPGRRKPDDDRRGTASPRLVAEAAAIAEQRTRAGTAPGASAAASMTMITRRGGRGRVVPYVAAALAAVAVAVGLYVVLGRDTAPARVVATEAPDARPVAPPVAPSVLIVETVPPGASGSAGDHAFGPTPATLEVTPGTVTLHLELAGFEPYVDEKVRVEPGQTLRLHLTLTPARARLAVETEPTEVDVSLDGEELGRTPLARRDLAPRKNARLRLSKSGYLPLTVPVELIGGEEARVFRALRPAPTPMGSVTLTAEDDGGPSWGDVFLGGKKIGEAGVGARPIVLPAGGHKLKVVNPQTGKTATVDVEVRADKTRTYGVKLQ